MILASQPPIISPWLGIGLVLAILGGLMTGLRVYQRRFSPHPEWVRKCLHIGMGGVTLSFPWLFSSQWPVILLAILAVSLLLSVKLIQPFNQQLGSVTHGVSRESLGEIYFPIAVALIFSLSQGNPILFGIPMLILTLADALAALIGIRYGLHPYTTSEGNKSAEGSFAFFTLAFLSTHVPLLLFTPVGRIETLLISMTLGLLVMLLEAIAWRGLDNLFIPLGGYMLLKSFLAMDVTALIVQLAATLILVVFTLSWRKQTTLNDSATLGAAFVGYLSWTLGGWQWLLFPLILLMGYTLWYPWKNYYHERCHTIYAVISVAFTGVLWLFLSQIFHADSFFYPYTLAFAAHLTIIDVAVPKNWADLPQRQCISLAILKGWVLIYLPFLAIQGFSTLALTQSAIALPAIALMAIAFLWVQSILHPNPNDIPLWMSRAGIVTLGSLLSLIPFYWLA
ncbi:hypothetical protein H6G20_23630 [Desertifilum sp. FACHB-1129]|uniref:Phosphatidate cytidylyltransferase n=2 Tax=Desertifilum tharense IPPAS B-1220 TaxID=1781255 RepID=A0A1E5QHR3_9CYAN|nr:MULTISPECIES: hypothetical protein [Desertifilum]MDA0211315.1 hypothetical protein [Cyanobacteria bacterium FC1]MBD2314664.1 hypothetical protein [Desertifilum sp. FACHB-1129]MBD2320276.1 hypothetical protein [Desertifilum sp. FACHB-866]MBD2330404.1 hypothetical protein [Desertifilum sp. FACHB-868]OEJ74134.1 hypothetical protein BH720_15980 [Desertifilum tharense IPPAS B-1220]